jgi:hypothetical protein
MNHLSPAESFHVRLNDWVLGDIGIVVSDFF